jgi:hypothetical protein
VLIRSVAVTNTTKTGSTEYKPRCRGLANVYCRHTGRLALMTSTCSPTPIMNHTLRIIIHTNTNTDTDTDTDKPTHVNAHAHLHAQLPSANDQPPQAPTSHPSPTHTHQTHWRQELRRDMLAVTRLQHGERLVALALTRLPYLCTCNIRTRIRARICIPTTG